MFPHIDESDWKLFRGLREIALERFCERVLLEVVALASDAEKSHHQRYLAVFRRIETHDRQIADGFDNPRRSVALHQLAILRSRSLLTDDEFARFSVETREKVNRFLGL